jgi:hypothetical protein
MAIVVLIAQIVTVVVFIPKHCGRIDLGFADTILNESSEFDVHGMQILNIFFEKSLM